MSISPSSAMGPDTSARYSFFAWPFLARLPSTRTRSFSNSAFSFARESESFLPTKRSSRSPASAAETISSFRERLEHLFGGLEAVLRLLADQAVRDARHVALGA